MNPLKDLWDKFDLKILLCCTRYKDRHRTIIKELDRVGISDYLSQWDISDTPLKDMLYRTISCDGHLRRSINIFSCCLQHYKAVKIAYQLECKSVLILEDDIRFRKDLDFIAKVIMSLPLDYDYAQFENVRPAVMPLEEYLSLKDKNIISTYWRRFDNLRGGGCYAISRRGMEKIIILMEERMTNPHLKLKINDWFVGELQGINKYFCYPNVAVQAKLGAHNSCVDGYWEDYKKLGMSLDEYNMDGTEIVCH